MKVRLKCDEIFEVPNCNLRALNQVLLEVDYKECWFCVVHLLSIQMKLEITMSHNWS